MTEDGVGASVVGVVFEAVDPGALNVDIDAATVPPLMLWCVAALSELAPDPARVRLVVTGDFVGSVNARMSGGGAESSFDLARGSGFVGGKTIPMPDGTIDVLLHAAWFVELDDVAAREDDGQMVKRTLAHEAQHVAMAQNDQGYELPGDLSWRMVNLRAGAESVIDEYRAELGVGPLQREGDARWDGVDVLTALRSDLARVVSDYQEHLVVDRLVHDVGTVSLVGWRTLAYMVAAGRVLPDTEQVPAVTLADPLWQRMAAGRWDAFVRALEMNASGTIRMERAQIDDAVACLAEVLGDWLLDLGFRWTDSQFLIVDWDLLDPAFIQETEDPDQG